MMQDREGNGNHMMQDREGNGFDTFRWQIHFGIHIELAAQAKVVLASRG
jgi:hypothetical protein